MLHSSPFELRRAAIAHARAVHYNAFGPEIAVQHRSTRAGDRTGRIQVFGALKERETVPWPRPLVGGN
jgi:hypothetical protein